MNNRRAALLFAACFAQPALATNESLDQLLAMDLEQLMRTQVTISTVVPKPITKAPSVVSAITAEDIKTSGASNLAEVLESVPGVHVRHSHFANRPLIHIRGANASQTLLMINGDPVKDLVWGYGIFWKGLPASVIERVEILRGPGSALFGADASAGAINVITKTAAPISRSEAGLRIGSFDSRQAWAQFGAEAGGFEIGLTADVSTSGGHDPFIRSDANGDSGIASYGWDNQDLRLSIAKGPWRLRADYMRHDNLETGMAGRGVLDPLTRGDDNRFNLDLIYDNPQFSDQWGLNFELHNQLIKYSSGQGFREQPPGYVNANPGDTIADGTYSNGLFNLRGSAERQHGIDIKASYRGWAQHSIMLGVGHSLLDLYRVEHQVSQPDALGGGLIDLSDTAFAFAPEQKRSISYLFVQDIWDIAEDWQATLGLRYDHYSDFGGTLNPRLALVWNSSDKLTTRLMYGQAFRPPSFQDLYPVATGGRSNTNLQPEESETWDLAFNYSFSPRLSANLNLYHYRQSNLINNLNQGSMHIHGMELEAWWQATDRLRLSGNYSLLDYSGSYREYGVPSEEAYLRLDWELRPDWQLNLQGNWVGERERRSGDARSALDGYWLADTTLRYSGAKQWEFAVSLRNLFDQDARAYTGPAIRNDLPLPGRSAFAELRYQF